MYVCVEGVKVRDLVIALYLSVYPTSTASTTSNNQHLKF